MFDVFHDWGGDLVVSSSGDLALVAASQATNQRVRRRLLTNSGDYLWNLDYGAGLALFVGSPASSSKIEAVVRSQLALETSIASAPAPQVSAHLVEGTNGYVVADITYADRTSSLPVQINITSG